MNSAHIVSRKRNRISRCNKKIAKGELTEFDRNRIAARAVELEQELKSIK